MYEITLLQIMNNLTINNYTKDISIRCDSEENNSDDIGSIDKLDNFEDSTKESDFIQQCEKLIEKLKKNSKEQRDEVKNLIKLYKKEVRTIKKTKKKRNMKDKTGFTKPEFIPDKLADFVNIPKGTVMSRTELTNLLYKEFEKRNLYYKNDKRVIIPDQDVKKLFDLSNDSDKIIDPKDKNGLNFYNLQKHIAKCYN